MLKLIHNELIKALKNVKILILLIVLFVFCVVFSMAGCMEWESEQRWSSWDPSSRTWSYYERMKSDLAYLSDEGIPKKGTEKYEAYARALYFTKIYEEFKEEKDPDPALLYWADDLLYDVICRRAYFSIAQISEVSEDGASTLVEYQEIASNNWRDGIDENPKVTSDLQASAQAYLDKYITMIKAGDWKTYYEEKIENTDDPDMEEYYRDMIAHNEIPGCGNMRDVRWKAVIGSDNLRESELAKYILQNDIETYVSYIPAKSFISMGITQNLADVPGTGISNFWPVLSRSLNALVIAGVIAVIIAAGCIAKEYSTGTIKFLLINPKKRMKIFWSKYIAMLICVVLLILFCFFSCFIMTGINVGGFDMDTVFVNVRNGSISTSSPWLYILISMADQLVSIFVSVTMAFMLSAVSRNSGIAVGIGLAAELISQLLLALGVNVVPVLMRSFPYANIRLMSIYYGSGILSYQHITASFLNVAIYVGLLLWIARDAFVRKEV